MGGGGVFVNPPRICINKDALSRSMTNGWLRLTSSKTESVSTDTAASQRV